MELSNRFYIQFLIWRDWWRYQCLKDISKRDNLTPEQMLASLLEDREKAKECASAAEAEVVRLKERLKEFGVDA